VHSSNGIFNIPEADKMKLSDYSMYPWSAEDFRDFVAERTKVNFGRIANPTLFNSPAFVAAVAIMIVPAAFGAWKVYRAPWFGHPVIWVSATLAVFMFATSGALDHNSGFFCCVWRICSHTGQCW
jgi:OST3 / OST6 family, transporter family